ncbi:MAG: SDR family oxidoreductase [Nocardioidaceae bacterium]
MCSTWWTLTTARRTSSSCEATSASAGDVRRAVDGVDVVYHNVAQVPLARDKDLFDSVNVGGTNTLLTQAEVRGCRQGGLHLVVGGFRHTEVEPGVP